MPPHTDSTAIRRPLREPVPTALKVRAGAAALGLAAIALAVAATPQDATPAEAVARVAAVALPVGLGLFRLAHERNDRFALLLLVAGAMWSLTTLSESSDSTLYSVGRVAVWLVELALVFLILAFPYGRIETAAERRLVAAVGILVGVLYLPTALLAQFPEPSPWTSCGTDCPSNAFLLSSHPVAGVDGVIRPLRETLTVALFALVTVTVTRRMLRSGEIMRRILAPVAAVAMIRMVTLAIYVVDRRTGQTSAFADAIGWLYVLSLAMLTIAFAAGLLAHRLFVADALERLTGCLSSRPTRRELRGALAGALRDPGLEVVYCEPDRLGDWTDATGRPVGPPHAEPGRALTDVTAEGRQLAAIVHDRDLLHDRALLEGITSYAVTSLENRHLVGELRASLEQLSRSRARLVTVADEERRKIERDLHDGAQQHLVALQIKLELLAERLDTESPAHAGQVRAFEDEIAETLDEVRRFSRGVYPPLLADRGLKAALNAVARTAPLPTTVDARLPHRYPPEVESAVYFACAEALQNATKHARGATSVTVSVSGNGRLRFDVRDNGAGFDPETTPGGAGLANLRERVVALGGELEIASEPGRGTRVTGMIPLP